MGRYKGGAPGDGGEGPWGCLGIPGLPLPENAIVDSGQFIPWLSVDARLVELYSDGLPDSPRGGQGVPVDYFHLLLL